MSLRFFMTMDGLHIMKARVECADNKPHALNPAIAGLFQSEYHWRGVSDAER